MYKNFEKGRSMIEMLGVLAIIAVLSVGGIAGYSKAMEMHKLNKWQEELIQTINNVQTAYLNQKSYTAKEEDITDILVAANIISNHKDLFGNKLSIFTIGWKNYGLRFELKYQMSAGKNTVNCCKKLYELPKYYKNIWAVGDWNSYNICGKAASLQYAKEMNCQEYNISKIQQKCNACKTSSCSIGILFDNNPG